MDPDVTYELMTDESNDLDERAVAATDLLVWASSMNEPRNNISRVVAEECKHRIFEALDRLAELEHFQADLFAQTAALNDDPYPSDQLLTEHIKETMGEPDYPGDDEPRITGHPPAPTPLELPPGLPLGLPLGLPANELLDDDHLVEGGEDWCERCGFAIGYASDGSIRHDTTATVEQVADWITHKEARDDVTG